MQGIGLQAKYLFLLKLTPFFGTTMSRTRFLKVLHYLHFADNSLAPRPDSPNFNKLYKILHLLDLIIPRFRAVYSPERQLAVDETLIKLKRESSFRAICSHKTK